MQYVDPVLSRCVKLILSTLQEQMMADQNPDEIKPPNVEFLIAALDLLSGIVQGMGSTIEPLIAQTNPPLLALLSKCIHVSVFVYVVIFSLTIPFRILFPKYFNLHLRCLVILL